MARALRRRAVLLGHLLPTSLRQCGSLSDVKERVDVNSSRLMHTLLSDEGVVTELIVVAGAGHGFEGKDADRANRAMVDWFMAHLVESN